MTQKGYFLVKLNKKSIDLELWSEDEQKLLSEVTNQREVVAKYFKNGNEEYLEHNGSLVRIA